MLNRLEKYKQLRSFAISSSLLGKIREVPFASNLVRLDCTAFEGEEAWLSMKLDAFKNLEELRLRSWETADEVSPTLWAFPGRLASLNEVVFAVCYSTYERKSLERFGPGSSSKAYLTIDSPATSLNSRRARSNNTIG